MHKEGIAKVLCKCCLQDHFIHQFVDKQKHINNNDAKQVLGG